MRDQAVGQGILEVDDCISTAGEDRSTMEVGFVRSIALCVRGRVV